jgi:hypothetical protein
MILYRRIPAGRHYFPGRPKSQTRVIGSRRDPLVYNFGLNPHLIIDGRPDSLPRFQVVLGGLNRDVAEQKLNLIQLTARTPAEPSAGSSQIVGRQCRDTCP